MDDDPGRTPFGQDNPYGVAMNHEEVWFVACCLLFLAGVGVVAYWLDAHGL